MESTKQYLAFISYKREDEEWAKWLQHKLEHYRLPSNLNGRSDLPKEIRPIFRDKSDLAGGVLADEINNALENSQYLIVICSPRAAQSEWVSKEVQTFIDLGRIDKIIPFIIGGKAHAQNPEDECFPLALQELPAEQELLGVNINEMGRDAAAVKVVAQMFGLKFDELWQRWEREQKKKRNWIIALSVIGFLVMAGIAGWIWWQYHEIKKKDWKMMENQARFVAEKARQLIDDGDCDLAQRLLIEVLPKDTEKPLVVEASSALSDAIRHNYTVLTKYSDEMYSAVYSPDGEYIATSSNDGTIIIWNAATGNIFKQFKHSYGDCWPYLEVKFSPNSKQIVSATMLQEPNIIFWDIESEKKIKQLKGYRVWYSPDSKYIAVEQSDGNTINLYDAYDWRCINTLECDGIVNSVAFSPDGKYVASALTGLFGEVVIWDIKTGRRVMELDGNYVSYSPDGKYLATCSVGGIIVWTVDMTTEDWNGIQVAGYTDFTNAFVGFSPDSKQIISATGDDLIIIWDISTGNIIKKLKGHTGNISSASYSPDGRHIVSASQDSTVRIWGTWTDKELKIHSLDGDVLKAETISYSPDGINIVSRFEDNTIRICNSKTCEEVMKLDGFLDSDWMSFPVYSPDGKSIVSTDKRTIKIWDSETGEVIKTMYSGLIYESALYSPDGTQIITTSRDEIALWNPETAEKTKTFYNNGRCFHDAVFSPDNRCLAIAADSLIMICDATQQLTYKFLEGHTDDVNAVSYKPDGQHLISTSRDRTIRIWDIKKCVEVKKIDDFDGDIISASYSADGKYIISESQDDTLNFSIPVNSNVINNIIRVWDADNYQEIMRFKSVTNIGFFQKDSCVTFDPEGKNIVYVNNGGYCFMPLITPLIDQTRERFKNNPLTPEERHQYYLE